MIDSKYLNMLKDEQPNLTSKVSAYLNNVIEQLIIGAICDLADKPFPEGYEYKSIHLGYHKLSHRKLIVGDTPDDTSVHVEFSDDCKTAYVAKRGFTGYQEVVLPPETAKAAKALFTAIIDKVLSMAATILPGNPKAMAIAEFVSETRYGTNEYLCKEFLDIYQKSVTKMLNTIESEEIRNTIADPLLSLKVTDIIEFLKENEADTVDIHVLN